MLRQCDQIHKQAVEPPLGCRDYVCILAWTVEWLLENNHSAFITYIDFKAAFDSLSHDYLIYSLRKLLVPEKYIRDRATQAEVRCDTFPGRVAREARRSLGT